MLRDGQYIYDMLQYSVEMQTHIKYAPRQTYVAAGRDPTSKIVEKSRVAKQAEATSV